MFRLIFQSHHQAKPLYKYIQESPYTFTSNVIVTSRNLQQFIYIFSYFFYSLAVFITLHNKLVKITQSP